MVAVCKVLETVHTSCCQVVTLQGLNWLKSPRLPSNMGNACTLQSFNSN
jgi:hypothetical protein